jgi:hypothetical protein
MALSEGLRRAHFIVNEANGTRSREAGKLASGNNLSAGAVLGKITDAVVEATGTNTGDGVVGEATIGTDAQNGTYTLVCTAVEADAGTFSVTAPNGQVLADLTVGVAYVSSHINITVADGATDWALTDSITVDVIFGEYAEHNPAGSDGSENAVAVLYDNVDATDAEQNCVVIARDCEVNEGELVFKTDMTEVQKQTAIDNLKTVGIIAR